jgi:hypothetical protein
VTSATQTRSQSLLQHQGSSPQIFAAQGSHALVSGTPSVQMACWQPTLPWHWPVASQLSPLGQVPHEPPQPSLPQTLPVQAGTHWVTH